MVLKLTTAAAALLCAAALLLLCVTPPDLNPFANRSRVLYDAEGNVLSYTLGSHDALRFKTTAADVDPLYLKMLLASEDHRFRMHPGVDPVSVARALWSNLTRGHTVSGASTLAMQVCRMLRPASRTLSSKFREALQALWLTSRYGREMVLDLYLTLAPFGSNIEGVKAASLRWFGHLPNHLTPAEAALLVALPRAPEAIRPDRHPQRALFYRNDVLRLAVEQGVLQADTARAAAAEALPQALRPLKRTGFHLGLYAFKTYPQLREIQSFIDPAVQKALYDAASKISLRRGSSAAVVVYDRRKQAFTGYLGAYPHLSSALDLPHALRSPGSALKPFTYALAFEQHLLHPQTILDDKERLYRSWQPRNYTRHFSGEITASAALSRSLNLPVLSVLQRVRPGIFLERLNRGETRLVLPHGSPPSLALTLGGGGINLVNLTALYAALADDGRFTEPRLVANDVTQQMKLLDAEAARATYEILLEVPRPEVFARSKEVSYKTGTSHGFRDAFALGSLGSVTMGVWIGRPDNHPSAAGSALEDAAPLLFLAMSKTDCGIRETEPLAAMGPLRRTPPPRLDRLQTQRTDTNALVLDFPLSGQTILTDSEGCVQLKYHGGQPPYYLTVNSRSLPDSEVFCPPAHGRYHLTLHDSRGRVQSADISVRVQGLPAQADIPAAGSVPDGASAGARK